MSDEELFQKQGEARRQLKRLKEELKADLAQLTIENQALTEMGHIVGGFIENPAARNPHAPKPRAEVICVQLHRLDLDKISDLIAAVHRKTENIRVLEELLKD